MSKALIAQMRAQREVQVTVGKFVFTVRRPTDVEAFSGQKRGDGPAELAANAVVGWKNVLEDDIVGGGGTDAVEFSPELWREWCADRPDFWAPITNAVVDAFKGHSQALEAAAKN